MIRNVANIFLENQTFLTDFTFDYTNLAIFTWDRNIYCSNWSWWLFY